jgi:hypothetical protein
MTDCAVLRRAALRCADCTVLRCADCTAKNQ